MDDKIKPLDVPRMMGDADLALIRDLAGRLKPDACLVEVGPWLGGVSRVLAGLGSLHVIDRFIWSDKNAESYPGIAQPGESFRAAFEANLADAPRPVQVHEADIRSFVWDGGPIDLCLIDAPRTAADLLACLRALRLGVGNGSLILVKNGLSPAHPELPALLEILLGQGLLCPVPTRQAEWCNILAVSPGPEWGRLSALGGGAEALDRQPLAAGIADPWGGATLTLARIAERLRRGDWKGALQRLAELPPSHGCLRTWDSFERVLDQARCGPDALAIMAELLAVQADPAAPLRLPVSTSLGPIPALRGFWANAAPQPWRAADFDADLVVAAWQKGAMELPTALGRRILGQRVLEIGPDPDLSGVGYLAGGAASYLGVALRPVTRAMLAAEARMTALRHVPAASVGADLLAGADLVVIRQETRGDPAVAQLIKALAPAVPRVVARRSRTGAAYEIT